LPSRSPGAWVSGPFPSLRAGAEETGNRAASCGPAGTVAGGVRRPFGPHAGDDLVELGPQQVLIAAHESEEPLVHVVRETATGGGNGGHQLARAQASIACCSLPLLAIVILRGLARSATGICKANTPAS